MNILILSAGRRVELVQRFQRAAEKLDITGKIIAADMSNLAPAVFFADKSYVVPQINDPGYLDQIIKICLKENIRLIIPTIDTELLLLSLNKQYIEDETDAKVLISSVEVINICRDKMNTQKFFEENAFLVPSLIKQEDIICENVNYPLFIKPLDGSSSINAFKVKNKKELDFFMEYISNPIVQEMIKGDEYTVDAFLDFDSNLISVVPRIRMATRGGEILKGKIIKDRDIIEDVTRLLYVLKPIGHITIQCMKTKKGIEYIEINPRFGGGAPMSIDAGADSCEYLYRLLRGEKLTYQENYRENILFLRFDQSIMLDENLKLL